MGGTQKLRPAERGGDGGRAVAQVHGLIQGGVGPHQGWGMGLFLGKKKGRGPGVQAQPLQQRAYVLQRRQAITLA